MEPVESLVENTSSKEIAQTLWLNNSKGIIFTKAWQALASAYFSGNLDTFGASCGSLLLRTTTQRTPNF